MPLIIQDHQTELLSHLKGVDGATRTLTDSVERTSARLQTRPDGRLHIGLLNMMPDAALYATENQFLGLVTKAATQIEVVPHMIRLDGIERGEGYNSYVLKAYETFDSVKEQGLDGLIITGANIPSPDLRDAPFWTELTDVMDWAKENVTSTLFSCLATHAHMLHEHGQERLPRADGKLHGVFQHATTRRDHPLTSGLDTIFNVPYSRHNEITRPQFEDTGAMILVANRDDVHMATSPDGLQSVYWQGHPEYDTISLLLEWKRDFLKFVDQEIEKEPPFPTNYLNSRSQKMVEDYRAKVLDGNRNADFPIKTLATTLDNTWRGSAGLIAANWLGAVYATTGAGRHEPLMEGVNPKNVFDLPPTPRGLEI